jgi:hypothetical protein
MLCAACNLSQTPAAPPTVTLPPAPTPSPLETYINPTFGYSFQYPAGLSVEGSDDSYIWLDRQISVSASSFNPEEARGDGPLIESAEDTTVGPYPARRLRGYIGAIGGNTPQSYDSVAIPRGGTYYVITVWELKNDAPVDDTYQPGAIPAEALGLFGQVLASWSFGE